MWTTGERGGAVSRGSVERRGASSPLLAGLALLLLLAACAGTAHASTPLEELATEADRAYRDGRYERAVELYERVLAAGYTGGPLLYNLGNAHYKAGHLGEAVLYWERALRAMPHSEDVRYNLELARSRTADRIEEPPRLAVWDWLDSLRHAASPRAVALAALGWALLASLLFGASLLLRRSPWVRIGRIGALATALLAVVTLAFVALQLSEDAGEPEAVILVDKVALHSAPDPTATEVFSLHEGTKVEVVRRLEQWREVRLADGRQGWLPAEAMVVI